MNLDELKQRRWFYEFELPDGTKTICDAGESVAKLHATRRTMLHAFLDAFEPAKPGKYSARGFAVDVACHQGYFAFELMRRGYAVCGFDINRESIADARLMAKVFGFEAPDAAFIEKDVRDWSVRQHGEAEIVLCFGLLYHCEDSVTVLRKAALAAQRAIIVETLVAPTPKKFAGRDIEQVTWGIPPATRPTQGWFALVEEDANRESGSTNLALVPTEAAVHAMLRACGFNTRKLEPPADGHESMLTHLQRGTGAVGPSRVMIVGERK